MTNKECFRLEESTTPNKWMISPVHENFHIDSLPNGGSCNIIAARLMGLTYAQYLRFCRDLIGGELHGKKSMYPTVYFSRTPTVMKFVRLLNHLANIVLWEREHPDWKNNPEFVAIKEETKKNLERWI